MGSEVLVPDPNERKIREIAELPDYLADRLAQGR